jgi:hypothetical protein
VPVAISMKPGAAASMLLPFRCPKTRLLMTTKVNTDSASLAKMWHVTMKIVCSYCGDVHRFRVRDAYTDAAMSRERICGID